MQSNQPLHKIAAFSILELTVVIALMALLSGLFFTALNRFNEQTKNEQKIKGELNNWFAIRANLWRELDQSDSIVVADKTASIYNGKTKVLYSIQNDHLFRRQNENEATEINLEMNSISQVIKGRKKYVQFNILWKNEEMILSYPLRSDLSQRMNEYFMAKKWQ